MKVYEVEAEEKTLTSKIEEIQESYWTRGFNECEVEVENIRKPIRALIDLGSEINLMFMELYNEG